MIKTAFIDLFNLFKKNSRVFLFFFLLAGGEFLLFAILVLMPDTWLEIIFKKPITTFAGNAFFHYPQHLFLLPKYYDYFYLAFFPTVGLFLIACFVFVISSAFSKNETNFKNIFLTASKRYLSFLFVWIIQISLTFLIVKFFNSLSTNAYFATGNKLFFQVINILLSYLGLCLINLIFFYSYPIIIVKSKRGYSAILNGIKSLKGVFFKTTLLVAIITLFYYLMAVGKSFVSFLPLWKTHPEISIIAVGMYVVCLILVDTALYSISTLIYLRKEGIK